MKRTEKLEETPDTKPLLTVKEVAARLATSRSTVTALIQSRKLPAMMIGPKGDKAIKKTYRIRPSDLEDFITGALNKTAADKRPPTRRAKRPTYERIV